jgi:hypothetical protein
MIHSTPTESHANRFAVTASADAAMPQPLNSLRGGGPGGGGVKKKASFTKPPQQSNYQSPEPRPADSLISFGLPVAAWGLSTRVIMHASAHSLRRRKASESAGPWAKYIAPSTALARFRQIRRNKGGLRCLGASEQRENYRF